MSLLSQPCEVSICKSIWVWYAGQIMHAEMLCWAQCMISCLCMLLHAPGKMRSRTVIVSSDWDV